MEGQRIFATLSTSETCKEARKRLTQLFGKSKNVMVGRYKLWYRDTSLDKDTSGKVSLLGSTFRRFVSWRLPAVLVNCKMN